MPLVANVQENYQNASTDGIFIKNDIGDVIRYSFTVTDTNVDREFNNEFEIHVVENQESTGGCGGRTPPNGENNGKNALAPMGISLPNVEEIHKERWMSSISQNPHCV